MSAGRGQGAACAARVGDLVAHLDGELGAAEDERLVAHLAACAGCRLEVARLAAVREIVARAIGAVDGGPVRVASEQPADFAAVLERIGAQPAGGGPRRIGGRRGGGGSRPASRSGAGRAGRLRGTALGLSLAGAGALAAVALLVVRDLRADLPFAPRTLVGARRPAAVTAPAPRIAGGPRAPGNRSSRRAAVAADPGRDLQVPAELRARPGLFVDMDVVKRLDKLRHLEAVYREDGAQGGGRG